MSRSCCPVEILCKYVSNLKLLVKTLKPKKVIYNVFYRNNNIKRVGINPSLFNHICHLLTCIGTAILIFSL